MVWQRKMLHTTYMLLAMDCFATNALTFIPAYLKPLKPITL
jgi:hypothetical protein